jgi:hypothetical protein
MGVTKEARMALRTRSLSESHPRGDPEVAAFPWIREGVLAGLAGAAVIAVLFGVLDVLAGRPLWTPHALGSALFLGEVPPWDAPISPALVGGYTVIHGWVFVAIGLLAAFVLIGNRLPGAHRATRIGVLALALFLTFGVIFAAFAVLMALGSAPRIGFGWILGANVIAAVVMAALFVIRTEGRGD